VRIENHAELRQHLISQGCILKSDTDSELVAHMVYARIQAGDNLLAALQKVSLKLMGAYAIAMIHSDEPNRIIVIRKGCPLVVGLADGKNLVASDTLALAPFSNRFIYLHDDDLVDVQSDHVIIYDKELTMVERKTHVTDKNDFTITKDDYPHFMLKEIYEQPNAIATTLQGRITDHTVLAESFGINAPDIFNRIDHAIKSLSQIRCS